MNETLKVRVARWPVFDQPGQCLSANLVEAVKKPLFWKYVPEVGILKINALKQLQQELTQNSNYYDSSSETSGQFL